MPASADAKRRASCDRAGSRTIAKNRLARVFEVRRNAGSLLYGCLRRGGRPVLLEDAYDDEYVLEYGYSRVRLAGGHVAWYFERNDISCKAMCPEWYDPYSAHIEAYDLARRRRREVDSRILGEALVLTPTGALAWAWHKQGGGGVDVHAVDRAGWRVLDSGDIPPESLRSECRMECSIVSWKNAGAERFARLR